MSSSLTFVSKRIYTGEGPSFQGFVHIEDGKIHSLGSGAFQGTDPGEVIDVGDRRIIPGLIDLHIHGSAGKNATASSVLELEGMAKFLAENGVTSFEPTTGASPVDVLDKAIEVAREFTRGPVRGARSLGLHMEGPFLNKGRKGAMPADLLLEPNMDLMKHWVELSGGTINYVTVAPELPGALELVRYLASMGVTVSMGHTLASYDEAMAGFHAGITVSNHTYNAMRELHHREPGALGAALTTEGVYCELIADGIHIHPAALRLVYLAKGPSRICLITDAMLATGLPRGHYSFLGRDVNVDEAGKVTLPDGTISGSTAVLRRCLKNMVELARVPFEEALPMATVNPAKVARVWGRKGSLAPGKDADIVVLDDDYGVVWSLVEGCVMKSPRS